MKKRYKGLRTISLVFEIFACLGYAFALLACLSNCLVNIKTDGRGILVGAAIAFLSLCSHAASNVMEAIADIAENSFK